MDDTAIIDPIAEAQPKPGLVLTEKPKRRRVRAKEIVPPEPVEVDAGEDVLEEDEIEDAGTEEALPDGPGIYEVHLKDNPKVRVKATGRDHAQRFYMKRHGILATENKFSVLKVA